MTNLTQEQEKVVNHGTGPALVLAPAGSGKSTTVLRRTKMLQENGTRASKILLTTFSKKSVEDLLARADKMGLSAQISTLHSLGFSALRECLRSPVSAAKLAKETGLPIRHGNVSVMSNGYLMMRDVLKKLKETSLYPKEFSQDPKHMLNCVSKCKRDMAYLSNEEDVLNAIEGSTSMDKFFIQLFKAYETAKWKAKKIDFDDMLYLGVLSVTDTQRQYEQIMVDEAQDSNPVQYALVNALRKNDNIMLVGDQKQAIYGFTGAIPEKIIGDFNSNFPGGTVHILRHNFRSVPEIVDVSKIIQETMPNPYGETVESGRPLDTGNVYKEVLNTVREEAEYVIGSIERGVDTAILYRINSQSRLFEDFLLKEKIPYTIVGGTSFYARKQVKDIVALASVLHNPRLSNGALSRVINISSPQFPERTRRLGAHFISSMQRIVTPFTSLFDAISQSHHTSSYGKGVKDLMHMVTKYGKKKGDTISDLLERAAFEIYAPYVTEVGSDNDKAVEEAINNEIDSSIQDIVDQLQSIADEYAPDDDFGAFTHYMANMERAAEVSATEDMNNPDVVKLMTIHKSKGMEFDTVFVTGAHMTSLPFMFQASKQDALVECPTEDNYPGISDEQRLFYVAVTRPKNTLHVTASRKTMRGWDCYPNPWLEM